MKDKRSRDLATALGSSLSSARRTWQLLRRSSEQVEIKDRRATRALSYDARMSVSELGAYQVMHVGTWSMQTSDYVTPQDCC